MQTLNDEAKIAFKGIYKLFGANREPAMRMLAAGREKQDILEETGCNIAVEDVDLAIREGEVFVVMGLSGSGKSTLIRMINGLISPTQGSVIVDDVDVAAADTRALRKLRRNKIAMVFQHFALFPHKSVADNTAFGLKARGVKRDERRQRALDALKQVGLQSYADARPDELSGGMQQRVGLARCLASDPEILLMDEPFSALDPLIRRDMQEDLLDLQRRMKKTIVFITHDLNEALTIGDRIAIMKDGRIVQVGTGEEIVDAPATDYVAAFTQDVDRSRVFNAASVRSAPEALDIATTSADRAIARMQELKRDALYVLDGEQIAGVVTCRDLSTPGRNDDGLRSAVLSDYPSAKPTTQLYDLYELAGSGLPIALTDRHGHLVGVVEPEALLKRLASGEDSSDTNGEELEAATPTMPPALERVQ